ncbi:MAG TPA: replication-associated recombination protein A, partial [bacterium]|nr:replication-associated recombination protein A [bacterium]
MRPKTLDEFVGQEHILGQSALLRKAIEKDRIPSVILWGPPGSGKTTLAAVMAHSTGARFVRFSAVTSGLKDLREVIEQAKRAREEGLKTLLFVDEIHRWNKAQQDAFLPHVEDGTVTLVGATTENPSFEVISALLSRCRVFVLKALEQEHLIQILRRAIEDKENGLGQFPVEISQETLEFVAVSSDGDARTALNALDLAVRIEQARHQDEGAIQLTKEIFADALQKGHLLYDKAGEEHYNLISALHKSLRGSDPDAALYWIARMIEAGEHPMYIARRMVRFATEDIGNADPQA